MKEIKELIEIAPDKKVDKLLKTSQSRRGYSLIGRYHSLVSKGVSEKEIVRKLYGKSRTPSHPAYRALKNRLRELITSAILDDNVYSSNYRSYDNAYVNGYRQLNLISILIARRSWYSVKQLSLLTFKRIKDYEILPLNSQLTSIIASQYLGVDFDEKKFEKYQALADYYAEADRVLSRVTRHYREMRKLIYAHKLLPNQIGHVVSEFVRECEPFVKQYPRVSAMQVMFYIMKVNALTMIGDYEMGIRAANEAEVVLLKCKGVANQSMSLIALTAVECSVKIGVFDLGRAQVARAEKFIPDKTINHIKLTEYAVTLGLQTQNYLYAYEQLAELDRNALKRLLLQQHIEFWLILEAYLHLLMMSGRIDTSKTSGKLPSFKLAKFINDVPSYAKDKQGMNIQILILQVIVLIIQNQYGRVIDRIDALIRYGSRYLRNNENLRNNCFFKLLITAERCQFHREATMRHASKTYQKMISKQAIELSRANSTEIVPYEELWSIVLENLESAIPDGRKLRGRSR